MEFADLKFENDGMMGERATAFFPNGYGASIVRGPYSYGGSEGLWELAVLAGGEHDADLCYDTPITSDVLGGLSKLWVTKVLRQIEALPARK